MGERKPNNYASQVMLVAYVVGAFATSAGIGDDAPLWDRVWMTAVWPYYITYRETYRYFHNAAIITRALSSPGST